MLLFHTSRSIRVVDLPIAHIRQNRYQSRKNYSRETLCGLIGSVGQNGILNPITVRKIGKNDYELVTGERRLRAAAINGMNKVPCIVMQCSEAQSAIASLTENMQHKELSFFEEADAILLLIKRFGISRQEIARRIGITPETVDKKLRLLKLCPEEREIILNYGLTERHALELLRISDKVLRRTALSEIIENGLNVGQAETYISLMLADRGMQRRMKQKNRFVIKDIRIFENTVSRAVSTMRSSGVNAVSLINESDDYIEFTVKIPKSNRLQKNLPA